MEELEESQLTPSQPSVQGLAMALVQLLSVAWLLAERPDLKVISAAAWVLLPVGGAGVGGHRSCAGLRRGRGACRSRA